MASRTCRGRNGRVGRLSEISISTTSWTLCPRTPSANKCPKAGPEWLWQHREARSLPAHSPRHHPGRPRRKLANSRWDSVHEEGNREHVPARGSHAIGARALQDTSAQETSERTK